MGFPGEGAGEVLHPSKVRTSVRFSNSTNIHRYRVYCASPTCSKFLNPSTHTKDASNNITYALCQDETCGKLTCTSCKTLLDGVEGHSCEQNEDYKKFKQIATEKGFQECPTCASTVELAEACNHIRYVKILCIVANANRS